MTTVVQANSISGSTNGVFYVGDTISIINSTDFTNNAATVIPAGNFPTVTNGSIRNGTYSITFTHTPPEPDCTIDPETQEEICDDPIPQEADKIIDVTIYNADQNYSGGVFAGFSGNGGTFKQGDNLSYVPPANNQGEDFRINLSSIGLSNNLAASTTISLPDGIDTNQTFPVFVTINAGAYNYTFDSPSVKIDTDISIPATLGTFTGNTGFNNTFKVNDTITYEKPPTSDNETFIIDLSALNLASNVPSGSIQTLLAHTVDNESLRFPVLMQDDDGNEITFNSTAINIDLIHPIFDANTLVDPYLSFDHDREYKGIGTEITLRTPVDSSGDTTAFSADFSDIGGLNYTSESDAVVFSTVELPIDNENYTKPISFFDDAGNSPLTGPLTLNTAEFKVDLIKPIFDSNNLLSIEEGVSPAKIGDKIKVTKPVDTTGDTALTYSIDLSAVGGNSAVFNSVDIDKIFEITTGSLNNISFNQTISIFDKALNSAATTTNSLIIDNKPPDFNFNCGGAVSITQRDAAGQENLIADFSNGDPDIISLAIDDTPASCPDAFTNFKVNYSIINPEHDDETIYNVDGIPVTIEVGEGSLDSLEQTLVLTIIDAAGNAKDFASGLFKIDNELINIDQLDIRTEGHPSTPDLELYVDDTITIFIQSKNSDIIDISAEIPDTANLINLIKDVNTTDQDNFGNDLIIKSGELIREFVNISYLVTDDAGNVGKFIDEAQKFFITNDDSTVRAGGGGSSNINRQDVFVSTPNKNVVRKSIVNSIQQSDTKVFNYLNDKYPEADETELIKRLKTLRKFGFDLGDKERAALRESSLKRRLNYSQKELSKLQTMPSSLEVQKSLFLVSRHEMIAKDKTPKAVEKRLIKRLSNSDIIKAAEIQNKLDDIGGLHVQNSLAKLKFSQKPKRKSSLRKTHLNNRGKFGTLK